MNIKWPVVLWIASDIVNSYETGVTLRQLFYRLVARQILPNTQGYYTTLSSETAKARRNGTFPALLDRTRKIHQPPCFDSPEQARDWLSRIYRRDRTEGQKTKVYIGVEKNGLVEQLSTWFWDYGIPILALGGYSSQTYIDDIAENIIADGRESILIYAGDFDPSGEDIERDFVKRCGLFRHVKKIALTMEQIEEYQLPENPGKKTDTRSKGFEAKYGKLVQVELDALEPTVLRQLYSDAISQFFDMSKYEKSIEREKSERNDLQ